ncbi:MAG: phage major capsid protein [Sedimentitalea sp.]|uniref:phage major capsid protein n=1 Tax=Sedimentitalea sp. TaxID=2048915 RepID=UPI0032651DCF
MSLIERKSPLYDEAHEEKATQALRDEAYRAAFDMRAKQQSKDIAALPSLTERVAKLTGEIEGLERALQRPVTVNATLPAPAKPKPAVAVPTAVRTLAVVIGAEFQRRSDHTPIGKFVDAALPGDANRLMRKAALGMHKSAINPGSTTGVEWAQELTGSRTLDLFEELAPRSAMAQLVAGGYARRLSFGRDAFVTIPRRETGTLPAAWIQEDATIPVKAGSFTTATAHRYKLGVIAAVSEEIRGVSQPEIVDLIEASILEDTATALDGFLVDAEAGVTGVRPAGIALGATSQVSSGSTVADVHMDLKWLLSQLVSIRARKPVLLIHPVRAASLSLTLNDLGVAVFADQIANGMLAGLPLIQSANLPTDQVIAVDADSLFVALEQPEIDLSNSATLVMADDDGTAPTMSETDAVDTAGSIQVSDAAGAGAQVRSMWQSWSVAVRFVQPTSWALARPGAVSVLTGVAW